MSNQASARPDALPEADLVGRHGPFARIVMVTAGVVFAAAFCALGAVVAVEAWRAHGPGRALLAVACALLVFAVAVYGGHLAWRGLRGYSNPDQFTRLQAWVERHPLALRLVFVASVGVSLVALVAGRGPNAMVQLQRGHGDMGESGLWWCLLGTALIPVQVAVHELGHAALGRLVGFRLVSLRLGPICFLQESGRWRLTWQPLGLLGVGGLVTIASEGDRMLRLRWALYCAGGTAANLLAAVVAGAIVVAAPPPGTAAAALWLGLLTGGAWTGAFALINLVPFELGSGLRSDGAQIASALARWGPQAALFRIGIEAARGRRPRTWGWSPGQLLEMAQGAARRADPLRYYALLVALDRGDAPAREEAVRQLRARWPGLSRALRARIEYQVALSRALNGDAVEARARLQGLLRLTAIPGVLGLLQATIAVAEGNEEEARAGMEGWERFLSTSGLGPAGRVGSEWAAEAIEARMQALQDRNGRGSQADIVPPSTTAPGGQGTGGR